MILEKKKKVLNYVEIYRKIWDVIDMINDCFTFPMVFIVFQLFISNTLSYFNIISEYNEGRGKFLLVFLTEASFSTTSYFVLSMCMHSCYCLSKEAEKTLNIASDLADSTVCDPRTKKMWKSFLARARFQKFKLETCFFTLDWKLILAVS